MPYSPGRKRVKQEKIIRVDAIDRLRSAYGIGMKTGEFMC